MSSRVIARIGAHVVGALAATVLPSVAYGEDPPKRPVPDYAGRPSPPPTPGEQALWVPRVIFSPVYFTTEYLLRRPIGALEVAAERSNLPQVLYNFFAFGPDHKAGFAPIAFVDFGINPSIGVYAFWDDAFVKGHDMSMHVSGWPAAWLGGSVVDRIRLANKDTFQFKLVAIKRPDQAFYGIGPRSLESSQSRYGMVKVDGSETFDAPLWRASKVEAAVGVRYSSFYDGSYGGDPGIEEQAKKGVFPLPDGYGAGYTSEYNRVMIAVDSRRPYPEEGSGVRVEAAAYQGSDVSQAAGSGWLRWHGGVGAFLDLDGHRRVVSLSAQTMFSDPLGPRPVPFTELVTLGGDAAPMPGFWIGRLVGRSAAVATLRYRWPIGPWLDGSMQAALGNVFGEHLQDFDTRLLRVSAALGLESDNSPDSNFQLLVGFGSETFLQGGEIDSFRLSFGINNGL